MYYRRATGVFLTHPQIEYIWVFPLLHGFRATRADTVDKEASLESIIRIIYIRRNSPGVYDIDNF